MYFSSRQSGRDRATSSRCCESFLNFHCKRPNEIGYNQKKLQLIIVLLLSAPRFLTTCTDILELIFEAYLLYEGLVLPSEAHLLYESRVLASEACLMYEGRVLASEAYLLYESRVLASIIIILMGGLDINLDLKEMRLGACQ